jgi:hypothetical protein
MFTEPQIGTSGKERKLLLKGFSWSGVVRGAVFRACGIGMASPDPSMMSPQHYGITVSEAFANHKHHPDDAIKDEYHGRKVVPNQLIWLVRRGDLLLPDEPLVRKFGITCKFSYQQVARKEKVRLTFVGTHLEDPPNSLSQLTGSE